MIARNRELTERTEPLNGGAGSLCPQCGCRHCPQMRGARIVRRFGNEFSQRERECRNCETRFVTEEAVVRIIKQHSPKPM